MKLLIFLVLILKMNLASAFLKVPMRTFDGLPLEIENWGCFIVSVSALNKVVTYSTDSKKSRQVVFLNSEESNLSVRHRMMKKRPKESPLFLKEIYNLDEERKIRKLKRFHRIYKQTFYKLPNKRLNIAGPSTWKTQRANFNGLHIKGTCLKVMPSSTHRVVRYVEFCPHPGKVSHIEGEVDFELDHFDRVVVTNGKISMYLKTPEDY